MRDIILFNGEHMFSSLSDIVRVLPHELLLTFVAGVLTGVLLFEGIVAPRKERRQIINRRLRGHLR